MGKDVSGEVKCMFASSLGPFRHIQDKKVRQYDAVKVVQFPSKGFTRKLLRVLLKVPIKLIFQRIGLNVNP